MVEFTNLYLDRFIAQVSTEESRAVLQNHIEISRLRMQSAARRRFPSCTTSGNTVQPYGSLCRSPMKSTNGGIGKHLGSFQRALKLQSIRRTMTTFIVSAQ